MRSFTHLLTYLHSWLCAYKTGNISETVEDRAKATINGLHKVVRRQSARPWAPERDSKSTRSTHNRIVAVLPGSGS